MDRMKRRDARLMQDRVKEKFCSFDKGGGGGSPPPAPAAPDPSAQILAQAKALPSQYGPFGSMVYTGDPNVAGDFKATTTLSPEQQKLYEGRTSIAQSLLDRSNSGLGSIPVPYKFNGASDPTTNAFFQNQKKLLDITFDRDQEREQQRLVNQGIPEGSDAYTKAMDDFSRRKSDAYSAAAANSLGAGFSQDISTRQQNLNEIAQALGGAQLQPVGSAGSPIDVAGAYANQQAGLNRQYQGQLAGYNADVAGNNSMMGGLFSLGAAIAPKMLFASSDRRLKRDIERLGEVLPGVGWYSFNYVWDDSGAVRRTGVMADELERVMPDAVLYDPEGYAVVDYGRLFAGRTVH